MRRRVYTSYSMSSSSIKIKIFLLKTADWVGLVGVLVWGVYATINAENRPFAAILALIALGLVNQFGRWTFMKIAVLKSNLRHLEKEALKH